MKIILSNSAVFEITDDILTIEEFLALAEKLRELTLMSRGMEKMPIGAEQQIANALPQSQPEQEFETPASAQENLVDVPVEERVFQLRKEGNPFPQIAKAYNITTSQARKLYQRVYQREWMRKNKKKATKVTKVIKRRKRSPVISRWNNREEVLNALKVHYFGTDKDKRNLASIKGKSWNDVVKSFWNLTKRYNIKPEDIGLKKWGKQRTEGKLEPYTIAPQQDAVLSTAEKQFIEFFNNYLQKGGTEVELKQAILLLREWLKSQGKAGSVQEILNFLGTKIKSLRPIVAPAKLEEWLR